MKLKSISTGLLILSLSAVGASALATPLNLVTNGSFESVTQGTTQLIESNGYGSNLAGWTTSSGYSFLLTSSQATSPFDNGYTTSGQLYTGSGTPNQIYFYSDSTSPDGGNFVAQDGGFMTGTLSQSISGLKIGNHYSLNFYMAATQQAGYGGATTDQWQVSLGGQNLNSAVINDASGGFSGWQLQNLIFTATATTETLGFLAAGTPAGAPPMVLLDGVSLNDIPEPSTLTLLGVGLFGIAALRRKMLARR